MKRLSVFFCFCSVASLISSQSKLLDLAAQGKIDAIIILLARNKSVNPNEKILPRPDVSPKDIGNTALHYLAQCQHPRVGEAIVALFRVGANPSLKNNNNLLPCELADCYEIKHLLTPEY